MLFTLLVLFSLTHYSDAFVWHTVSRGEVGIYYRVGRLLPEISTTGTYLKFPPPITFASKVDISPQTDNINNINCYASDGTSMPFPHIAVGNHLKQDYVFRTVNKFGEDYDGYLVIDKVRAQIQVICGKMTSDEIFNTKFDTIDDQLKQFLIEENEKEHESGVIIDFVRMSKPQLPRELQEKYNMIAKEKLNLQIANAEATTLEQVYKNDKYKAVALAEKQRAVSFKENEKKIESKKHEQTLQTLDDERLLKMKTQEKLRETISREIIFENKLKDADANYEFIKKQAEGNKLLLTPEYLELKKHEAYYNNAKHYGQINPTLFLRDDESNRVKEREVYMSKYDKMTQ